MVQISLMKSNLMLLNDRVSAFTVCELLKENQQGGLGLPTRHPHPPRLNCTNIIISPKKCRKYIKYQIFYSLNVIKLLISSSSFNWLMNLSVTFERLCVGVRSVLLILRQDKVSLFCLIVHITLLLI